MNRSLIKPGVHKRVFSDDRRYTTYIPESFAKVNEAALIMLLHWKGPFYPFKGWEILSGLGIPAFDELGAIIAASDCPADRWDDPASQSYVVELHKRLTGHYRIKKNKTLSKERISGLKKYGASNVI